MLPSLTPGDKDDASLARIDVVILQDEELVHAVLLQRCNFDNCSYRADKTAIEYQVLLPAYLIEVVSERVRVPSADGECRKWSLRFPRGATSPFETCCAPAQC